MLRSDDGNAPVAAATTLRVLFIGCWGCEHNTSQAAEVLQPKLQQRGLTMIYLHLEELSTSAIERSQPFCSSIIYLDHKAPKQQRLPLLDALRRLTAAGKWIVTLHSSTAAFAPPPRKWPLCKGPTPCSAKDAPTDEWARFIGGRFYGKAWTLGSCCHGFRHLHTKVVAPEHPVMRGLNGVHGWEEEYLLRATDAVSVLETISHDGKNDLPWTWIRHPLASSEGGVFYTGWGDGVFHDRNETNALETEAFADLLASAVRWAVQKPAQSPSPPSEPPPRRKSRVLELRTGQQMPIVGLGTGGLDAALAEAAARIALELGYQHFDTAESYHNEEGLGRAFAASSVPRHSLFVVTKYWGGCSFGQEGDVLSSLRASLGRLQLAYVTPHRCTPPQ